MTNSITPFGSLSVGIGEAPCNFTFADLKNELARMLDDDFTYWTSAELGHNLNRAERLFCWLTLAYERTVTFNLTNASYVQDILAQLPDFWAALRITHTGGVRLRPMKIHELDARDKTWRARAGSPLRYAQVGFQKLFITPQPASGSHTLEFVYAAEPSEMVAPSDVPALPSDQQAAILDIAFYLSRQKEGSSELQGATEYLKRGVDQARKYFGFTLAKARAQNYDLESWDLRSADLSRFEIKLARQKALVEKQKRENAPNG